MQKKHSIDLHFLRMAWLVGGDRSKDPKTKVGSIIISEDTRKISSGFNGLAAGIEELPERWVSPAKHDFVIHAEENSVINRPFDTEGCIVYVSHQPCHRCLSVLRNARISRLVFNEVYDKINWDVWEQVITQLDEVTMIEGDLKNTLTTPINQLTYKYHTVVKKGQYNKGWRKVHERVSIRYAEQGKSSRFAEPDCQR